MMYGLKEINENKASIFSKLKVADTKENYKYFLYGCALYAMTDVFAHSTTTEDGYLIDHSKPGEYQYADNVDYYSSRYKLAGKAVAYSIQSLKDDTSLDGAEFLKAFKNYYTENTIFKMVRLKKYLNANGYSGAVLSEADIDNYKKKLKLSRGCDKMTKIRKRLPTVLLILLAVLFIPGIANAKTKEYQGNLWNFKKTIKETSGAFTYYAYPSKNQKEAWIYKIDLISDKNCSKLSIPSKLDNKKVTRLGSRGTREGGEDAYYDIFGSSAEPWYVDDYVGGVKYKIDRIKKLEIPNTVKIIQPVCFSNMHSIKAVKIPKSVKTLGKFTFFRCNNLKKVELPAGLNSLDVLAFYKCTKLADVRISSKNKTYQCKDKFLITKKKKELILAPASKKTLKIPDGIKSIEPFAFSNCTSATVHIPATVKKMKADAFRDPYSSQSVCIKNVTLDDKNSVYAKDGQCIYNKTDKSLSVAIPDETCNLYISDQVEKLTSDRIIVGWNVRGEPLLKVVYPKTLKTVVDYGFIRAESIYFTGEKPPELVRIEAEEKDVAPPCFTHVYVPERSAEIYRQWYKDHDRYDDIYGFDTFKPEDAI